MDESLRALASDLDGASEPRQRVNLDGASTQKNEASFGDTLWGPSVRVGLGAGSVPSLSLSDSESESDRPESGSVSPGPKTEVQLGSSSCPRLQVASTGPAEN